MGNGDDKRSNGPPAVVSRTGELGARVEMRPKVLWRVASPAVTVLFAVASVAGGGAGAWIGSLTCAVLTAAAFRGYIRVEDAVVYRRGAFRWHPPLDLNDLADLSIRRLWYMPFPHLELWMFDGDRNVEMVSLRWWSNWESLVRIVAVAASEPVKGQPDRRQWRLDLDQRTRHWLDPRST